MHQLMAGTLDTIIEEIRGIKADARRDGASKRPLWPMLVLRTPKGWTCPKEIDGHPAEGSWRAHQVPLASARDTEEHLRLLETWMRSYRLTLIFALGGLAFSLYLAHIEKDVLGVWCVYCVISLAVITLITLIATGAVVATSSRRPKSVST